MYNIPIIRSLLTTYFERELCNSLGNLPLESLSKTHKLIKSGQYLIEQQITQHNNY